MRKLMTLLLFISGYSFGMDPSTAFWHEIVSWDNMVNNNLDAHKAVSFELYRANLFPSFTAQKFPAFVELIKRHIAVEYVNYLCFCGANPNCTDTDGKTPLHIVAENGYDELVEELLKCGALSKIKDAVCGETALHTAIRHQRSYIACLLLENDKRLVYEKDNNGNTPLHLAVLHNRSVVLIKDLLKYGSGFTILRTNNYGQNVIDIALAMRNQTLHSLLVKYILSHPLVLEE